MFINKIRNFSIIAHIDHGKSTLSDRFIQQCNALSQREMSDQVLDSLEIEKNRGITVKAQTVCLEYNYNNTTYKLNFIDTPGHVDFSYEVSRSLASCEGALLLVDASSGIQAQTIANCKIAIKENLTIIPVINKIDLPSADPEKVKNSIEQVLNIDTSNTVYCSAKTGFGCEKVLQQVVNNIPAPNGDINAPLKARIIDSWFDIYLGVVTLIRIYDGQINKNDKVKILGSNTIHKIDSLGIFTPKRIEKSYISAGEVGYIIMSIRDISVALVGDTICNYNCNIKPMPGFQKIVPMIYALLFPEYPQDFEKFRSSIEKLAMNDNSFKYESETSMVLGHGFRCGFLGILHMEVIKDRLKYEHNLEIITTAPSVTYLAVTNKETNVPIKYPHDLPKNTKYIKEPLAKVNIIIQQEYVGSVIRICQLKRGQQIEFSYVGNDICLVYILPMIEVINNLTDKIKSVSHGFGSFSYEFFGYKQESLHVLDIKINDQIYTPFSQIVHEDNLRSIGTAFVEKLAENMDREQFEIKIQACVGSKVIARSNIRPFRKDVTAKCYGGDITRKKKLLKKQNEGKKRIKQTGRIRTLSKIANEIIRS